MSPYFSFEGLLFFLKLTQIKSQLCGNHWCNCLYCSAIYRWMSSWLPITYTHTHTHTHTHTRIGFMCSWETPSNTRMKEKKIQRTINNDPDKFAPYCGDSQKEGIGLSAWTRLLFGLGFDEVNHDCRAHLHFPTAASRQKPSCTIAQRRSEMITKLLSLFCPLTNFWRVQHIWYDSVNCDHQ